MRLAEDRILSFVCVFSTGMGTKWITGATFFYQPEIRLQNLLTQRYVRLFLHATSSLFNVYVNIYINIIFRIFGRRRWINGTFASFAFFFVSGRARSRVSGGFFDE